MFSQYGNSPCLCVDRQLCTGEAGAGKVYRKPLHYKGSAFHRIIPQVWYEYVKYSRSNVLRCHHIVVPQMDI